MSYRVARIIGRSVALLVAAGGYAAIAGICFGIGRLTHPAVALALWLALIVFAEIGRRQQEAERSSKSRETIPPSHEDGS